MANRLSRGRREDLVRNLGLGFKVAHIAYALNISEVTVSRYQSLLGDMLIDYMDSHHTDFAFARYEFDEYFTYLYCQEYNVERAKNPPPEAGRLYHYQAVVPGTGFIPVFLVATTNGEDDTTTLLADLEGRLRRTEKDPLNPQKEQPFYANEPVFVFDGLGSYPAAIKKVFGKRVRAWQLVKKITTIDANGKRIRRRFDGVVRNIIIGPATDEEFWTNNVESGNRTARARNSRVQRKTTGFSKSFLAHTRQEAIRVFFQNYCFVPSRSYETPAQKAKIIDRVIGAEELVDMLELYEARMREEGLLGLEQPSIPQVDPETAPYFAYRNFDNGTVRVHARGCRFCNGGQGRGGEPGKSGKWYAAESVEQAIEIGQVLIPDHVSGCRDCLSADHRNRSLDRW